MFFRNNAYAITWIACMFALNLGRKFGNFPTLKLFYFIYFDKFAHFLQFCILVFLLIVGFSKQYAFPLLRFSAMRISLVIGVVYAFFLEAIFFIMAREYFEWGDLAANLFGCLGGLLIFYFIYKFKE